MWCAVKGVKALVAYLPCYSGAGLSHRGSSAKAPSCESRATTFGKCGALNCTRPVSSKQLTQWE